MFDQIFDQDGPLGGRPLFERVFDDPGLAEAFAAWVKAQHLGIWLDWHLGLPMPFEEHPIEYARSLELAVRGRRDPDTLKDFLASLPAALQQPAVASLEAVVGALGPLDAGPYAPTPTLDVQLKHWLADPNRPQRAQLDAVEAHWQPRLLACAPEVRAAASRTLRSSLKSKKLKDRVAALTAALEA